MESLYQDKALPLIQFNSETESKRLDFEVKLIFLRTWNQWRGNELHKEHTQASWSRRGRGHLSNRKVLSHEQDAP